VTRLKKEEAARAEGPEAGRYPQQDCELSAEVPVAGADGKPEARAVAEAPGREIYGPVSEPTLASAWYAASGAPITDRLLE
jgi:hypothetical protein